MDIRGDWVSSDTDLYYSLEETISDVKSNFDFRRYKSAEGSSSKIDDVTTQVIVQSHLNPLNRDKIDNIIHMPIETLVQTGSIVDFENEKWIIVSDIDDLKAYKSANMVKSNNTLLFYPSQSNENPISNDLIEIPCIVGKGNINLDTNKFLSIPADENLIICPNNSNSSYINENTRFILSGSAYVVQGIDNISNVGLLNIRVKQDQISADDNLELGISNYWSNQSDVPIDLGDVWLK